MEADRKRDTAVEKTWEEEKAERFEEEDDLNEDILPEEAVRSCPENAWKWVFHAVESDRERARRMHWDVL